MGLLSLNSNLSALAATRRLGQVETVLGRTMERLSSGQRILRASDDPAGLAVGAALEARGKLFRQADRNVRDGLSALEILDGALGEQSNILIRMGELAEQAANGSLSDTQRAALQVEYSQLQQEFARTAATTKFNNQILARADNEGVAQLLLQVGISGQESSMLSAPAVDTGLNSGTLGQAELVTEGVSQINSFHDFAATHPTAQQIFSQYGYAQRIRMPDAPDKDFIAVFFGSPGSSTVSMRGFVQIAGTNSYEEAAFEDEKTTSDAITLQSNPSTGAILPASLHSYSILGGETFEYAGTLPLDYRALRIKQSGTSAIDITGVETSTRGRIALDTVQRRISELASIRGNIGAASSRLQAGLAVTNASEQNTAAALSRIRDIDVAGESSTMMTQQILRQAASAVLAQANQQPALALALLRA